MEGGKGISRVSRVNRLEISRLVWLVGGLECFYLSSRG